MVRACVGGEVCRRVRRAVEQERGVRKERTIKRYILKKKNITGRKEIRRRLVKEKEMNLREISCSKRKS